MPIWPKISAFHLLVDDVPYPLRMDLPEIPKSVAKVDRGARQPGVAGGTVAAEAAMAYAIVADGRITLFRVVSLSV